ncbi:MAG: GNAT family N-acetyltransferase [Balneola sp.]|jgi:ribosomal-protein-alanine N-acetyltransferase
MNDPYFFTSKRLGFRKFKEPDFEFFYSMNSDPEVMKYFPSVLNKEQTRSLMNRINAHIDEHGFGFYAVDLLSENTFIGFIGLKRTKFEADFTPCVEIGWRLGKEYWNRGLATEGAARCLDHVFSVLSFDEIYSFTSLLNKASERVMQKIGMKKIEDFNHPLVEDNHPLKAHCLYRISK